MIQNLLGKAIIILLIFGLVAGIELPGIIKKKQWRDFFAYLVFFISGLIITALHQVLAIDFSVITDWFIAVFSLWN